MIKVWGRKTSSNVQAVMWSLAELGMAHERTDRGHHYGGLDTAEFLAMNPNGTIPVMRDGDGEFLWESSAILRYLANRYGRAPYWPDDLAARTHIDRGGMVEDQYRAQFLRADFLARRPHASGAPRPRRAQAGDRDSRPLSRHCGDAAKRRPISLRR
jgi:glutathione S-transferase